MMLRDRRSTAVALVLLAASSGSAWAHESTNALATFDLTGRYDPPVRVEGTPTGGDVDLNGPMRLDVMWEGIPILAEYDCAGVASRGGTVVIDAYAAVQLACHKTDDVLGGAPPSIYFVLSGVRVVETVRWTGFVDDRDPPSPRASHTADCWGQHAFTVVSGSELTEGVFAMSCVIDGLGL